jgi:chorismate-pyruvate lyase
MRGPLEFARLIPGDGLYHRALRAQRDLPDGLWARRSWFAIDGDRLLVQEVFLPESHP